MPKVGKPSTREQANRREYYRQWLSSLDPAVKQQKARDRYAKVKQKRANEEVCMRCDFAVWCYIKLQI